MQLLSTLARRLRDERGFTMIAVMLVVMVTMLFTVAAYETVRGDTVSGRNAQNEQLAYAAAESGLSWYEAQLTKDPSYWTQCASVPQISGHAAPVWDGQAASTRAWADVNDPTASYSSIAAIPASAQAYDVELLPANGQTACSTSNPDGTMIDSYGTFRVRVSGRAGGTARAIIGTFRRKGFLDYLYYTKFETLDSKLALNAIGKPSWPTQQSGVTPSKTFDTWTADNCNVEYWTSPGRLVTASPFAVRTYTGGQYDPPGSTGWTNFNPRPPCTDVQFATGDQVDGPLHTQDSLLVCGSPTFGGSASDAIEVEAPAALAVRDASAELDPNGNSYWGCTTPKAPNSSLFIGTLKTSASPITPPDRNDALASAVSACCRFLGRTAITLNGNTMTVKNSYMGFPGGKTITLTGDTVIYASTAGTCSGYNSQDPDNAEDTCGNIRIQGTSKYNLTVGADNDIIITGNLQPDVTTPNVLIGLIATSYVRVWHPVGSLNTTWYGQSGDPATFDNAGKCTSSNATSSLNTITIKAAILALQHSFLVDNWRCGARMISLNVIGAIAQLYRGPVGTNGATPTGYPKNYVYDTRLKYRTPPSFLSPVQSSWRLVRVQEQAGAASIQGR